MEKQRRDRIKKSLEELASLIPEAKKQVTDFENFYEQFGENFTGARLPLISYSDQGSFHADATKTGFCINVAVF